MVKGAIMNIGCQSMAVAQFVGQLPGLLFGAFSIERGSHNQPRTVFLRQLDVALRSLLDVRRWDKMLPDLGRRRPFQERTCQHRHRKQTHGTPFLHIQLRERRLTTLGGVHPAT
jgi:hypothetical protein